MKSSRIWVAFMLLSMLLSASTFAQMKQIGEAKTDSFPSVTVRVNLRDPEIKPATFFNVEDGGKDVKFTLKDSAPKDSGRTKSILILWEYLPSAERAAQAKFFREVLVKALPDILEEGDELGISTFAWSTPGQTGKYLFPLEPTGFGNNTEALSASVTKAISPNGKGIDEAHGSELFPAISEGIDQLATRKSATKMLIVLSGEFPNIFNRNDGEAMVTAKAIKADVAVYNMRFEPKNAKYFLDDLAKNTHGLSFAVNKSDPTAASGAMLGFAEEAVQRSLGMNYVFTFATESQRDGKTHPLQIKAGTDVLSLNYEAPSLGFGGWIQANLILFVLIIVLILGAAVGIFLWMRKRNADAEQRRLEEQRKLEQVESAGKETEGRLQQQNSALERIQREEQDRRKKIADEQRKAEAERETKALLEEMYANGRQPRLTTILNGHPLTMELPSPVTTVGRDASCDVQVADQTMSRTHFQVIYQNGKYLLLDLGSTNGTLLNGSRMQQSELRHGDQIKAGEAILFFYL